RRREEQISKDCPPLRLRNFLRPFHVRLGAATGTSEWHHPAAVLGSEARFLQSQSARAAQRSEFSGVAGRSPDRLQGESELTYALHHADRSNPRAPTNEVGHSLPHLTESAGQPSDLYQFHRRQANPTRRSHCASTRRN